MHANTPPCSPLQVLLLSKLLIRNLLLGKRAPGQDVFWAREFLIRKELTKVQHL